MTDLTDLDRRLLSFVGPEPESATQIWRHFAEIPPDRHNFTTGMRRHRRTLAQRLEALAEDGHIQRTSTVRRDAQIPLFYAATAAR